MSEAVPTEVLAGQPAPMAPAARALPMQNPRIILERLRDFGAQPAVAKSLPAIAAMAAVGLALILWLAFSAAPSRVLFAGLGDGEKGAVVEALGAAGIDYSIDSGSGAVSVPEDSYHQARMLLASQGLPKSAPDGSEMISGLPLGASRAVEGERLRGAKELDLARSIEAIDAVESARVHLAVETPSVFVRERSQRSASVVLRLAPGRVLGAEQVQAIVHLVASSVPGLTPEAVSVIDQNGKLLSSGGGDATSAVSDRRVAVQAKIEERYRQTLTALLTPIVGAGNFTAEVHADLDFSENQATRETFPKDASAVRSEEGSWTSAGGGENATGIPGALSNQAPTATTVAAAPGAELDPNAQETGATVAIAPTKTAENFTRNFATGREVSVSKQAPGQLRRLSVAVALRQPDGSPRSRQDLAEIEALVKGAVGFSQARGDVVALSARSFAPVEEAGALSWWDSSWVPMLARNLTGLLIAALLIFGLGRPLMLRRAAAAGARKNVATLDRAAASANAVIAESGDAASTAAATMPEPEPQAADVTLKMLETAPSYEARAVLIRNFVRQDPDRAALVLRDLLRDDRAEDNDNG